MFFESQSFNVFFWSVCEKKIVKIVFCLFLKFKTTKKRLFFRLPKNIVRAKIPAGAIMPSAALSSEGATLNRVLGTVHEVNPKSWTG